MYTMGLDIGSTTSKCIILKDGKDIVASVLKTFGTGSEGGDIVRELALEEAGITSDDILYSVVTGYGRTNYKDASTDISELSCHAKGCCHVNPNVRTIIDIGGQDAKVIRIDDKGRMDSFLMNDKCAAGTGRFLDVMATILKIDIGDLEVKAMEANVPSKISSTCTVFAESEVISQLSKGAEIPNVVAGICNSVAVRVAGLAKRVGVKDTVFMSGGVAQNGGVRLALERELGTEVKFNRMSQMLGALGAAIIAYEKVEKI
jgi:predicted CoA-substrate-specific enzyme activase